MLEVLSQVYMHVRSQVCTASGMIAGVHARNVTAGVHACGMIASVRARGVNADVHARGVCM